VIDEDQNSQQDQHGHGLYSFNRSLVAREVIPTNPAKLDVIRQQLPPRLHWQPKEGL
jgi:hypothetical protein